MAEIPDSESSGTYASSPAPRLTHHLAGVSSDSSSDFDSDEADDNASFGIPYSDASSAPPQIADRLIAGFRPPLGSNLDADNLIGDEDDEDDEDGEVDYDDEEADDDDFDNEGLDDFDFDMRDAGLDFHDLEFLDPYQPGVEDFLNYPDENHFDLHHQHALLQQLEHHFAHDHWGLLPLPPMMDHPPAGSVGARTRSQRDQLVQVEVAPQGNAGGAAGGAASRQQRHPHVIDLTGDDDAEIRGSALHNHPAPRRPSENPRRRRSQPQNAPPRLNRSDGNYVDNQSIIILSSSDDEDRPMRASPRRNANNGRNNQSHLHNRYTPGDPPNRGARSLGIGEPHRDLGLPAAPPPVQASNPNPPGRLRPFTHLMNNLPLFQLLSSRAAPAAMTANRDDDIVITGERNIVNLPNVNMPAAGHPFALGPIHLDYGAHAFAFGQPAGPPPPLGGGARAGPSKPAHEPPQPARPGFTRDTGEDVVAICPSCEQELAYDPEGDDGNPTTPAKKGRSKKAMAEHHFWAVKNCGHVYCKRCFDNRRPGAKGAAHVSFRADSEGGKKVYCAVDDCESEVSAKTAWVGIFM
ncbi:hypothetical protein F4802DRAFT_611087 [Xylaria palmicola]|nr:hypothetical protein F4802DRAFT_611087 [Xylaria palmicola]